MAKITLPTIAAGYASNATFNTAFAQIDAEFQGKVLYRNNPSGEPNTMQNLLDMNSNPINNVTMLTATGITVAGVNLTAKVAEAAASATAAAASAAAAVVSKNAAAASATAAAGYVDTFDDKYLGSKSSAPTVDNDGDALTDGALYFNTTSNIMFVYDLGSTTWLQLTLTTSNQNNVNTVAGISGNVTTVAGISANVTTVAGIASNVTSVAGNASNINTVAGAVSNVNAVGSNISNINAVAGNATNINTVAADASDIGAVAGKVTEIGRLGTAAAVADLALLGTAAVVTDLDLLGTSANVTAMGVLGTSANVTAMGLLGTSANVTNMATLGASGVVTNIATVATNVAGVNSFADLYRGAAGSDPSGTVTTGSLYYNTALTPKQLKIYDGSNWVTAAFDASGSVTAFNGRTGSVTLSNADVLTALSTGAILTAKLADDAVTADKLANSINTAIAANTAKTGITTGQANAITANTAKTGITTGQANAITANTAKVTNATHSGDVTGSGALTIANNAVTKAKVNFISDSTAGVEVKGDGSSQDGYIQLNCSQNSHGVKIKSPPHSAGASYTLTLPNNDGDADQVLKTNGSGVTSWGTISSTPTNLQIPRTVTGSVTALRAVSIAPDASIGAYPTVNTLSSQVQSDTSGDTVTWVDGRAGQTSARMTGTLSGSSHVISVYGLYRDSDRKWKENSTPLTITLSLDSGTMVLPVWNSYPRGISTQANTFLVFHGGARNTGVEAVAQVTAVKVNPSTGVPTIEGSSSRRSLTTGSGGGGAAIYSYGEIADGRYKCSLVVSGAHQIGIQWRYTPGSGFSYQDVTNAHLDKLTTNYEYYNVANPPGYTQLSADGTKLYFTAIDHANSFNRYAISSNWITDAVKVNIAIPCPDYLGDGKAQFLDSTHFVFYYKNTGNRYAVKTFSISGDTPTLIDTELAPVGFTKVWNICPKLSDTKKMVLTSFNNPGGGVDHIFSLELASDYTITGFSPLQTIAQDTGENMQPRNESGNLFNLIQLVGGYNTNQTYTVNAYSTTQFTYGGIATASASSGTTPVLISGLSSGHSGLTVGADYFVKNTLDGLLTADSALATSTRVGKAISTTEIIVGDIK